MNFLQKAESKLEAFFLLGCLMLVFMQAHMLTSAAMRAGFSGGLVVEFPHSTRAKKYFLVLMVGSATPLPAAEGMEGGEPMDEGQVNMINRKQQKRRKINHAVVMVSQVHSLLSDQSVKRTASIGSNGKELKLRPII